MRTEKNLKMRQGQVLALFIVFSVAGTPAFADGTKKKTHHHQPKHIVEVNLSDAPSESELEALNQPLALHTEQKVAAREVQAQSTKSERLAKKAMAQHKAKKILVADNLASDDADASTFGTEAEGRAPASIDAAPVASTAKTHIIKLNKTQLHKMLQAMRKKTDQSVRQEYD